mmetsp:Transcript_6855/g.14077  ORF Transcript_6855/g.14077 Transcript_6855/m.14077 type:complete len:344 (+) Transcript_6855:102-1133(+)
MDIADNAAIVSETDAAHSHSSSDEDDERHEYQRSRTGRHRQECEDFPSANLPVARSDENICGSINQRGVLSTNDQTCYDDSDEEMDGDESRPSALEQLYCENMDDEDEAWVYKHMRSGQEEVVYVRRQQSQQENQQQNIDGDTKYQIKYPKGEELSERKAVGILGSASSASNATTDSTGISKGDLQKQHLDSEKSSYLQKALLLKPRTSDAILSCPRCFNIVCMDCQQHERYANQFRAMFVMNIGVDWQKRMMYDDAIGGLKILSSGHFGGQHSSVLGMRFDECEERGERSSLPNAVPREESGFGSDKEEIYYSVHCNYCRWEVAALDMTDEIYYFYGCIASS